VALLRRVIGDALRARRQGQHRTLRDVSTAANVSLGYLSEIERGQKEASSELLAAICQALGSHVSEVLRDASDSLAQVERADAPLTETPVAEPVPESTPAPEPALVPAATFTAGQVSVSVRRDGPFRTTLHAVRKRPRQPVGPRG
jgi:transcriptional regulator with XRE-family HTH domain